jgi:hypothetical protein
MGEFQDKTAIDSETNIDFVETVLSQILCNSNPELVGDIASQDCNQVRLPDNLQVMSLYHQELTHRYQTDSSQNTYKLLMKSNEKLTFVLKTIQ